MPANSGKSRTGKIESTNGMINGKFSGINPSILNTQDDEIRYFKIPTKFILKDEDNLCCPVCGCSEVHLGEVQSHQGHQTALSTNNQTIVLPSERHAKFRGSAVGVLMHCECRHEFLWRMEFHKGTTFFSMYARNLKGYPHESPLELWRD